MRTRSFSSASTASRKAASAAASVVAVAGGGVVAGEIAGECAVAELGDLDEGLGLAAELDLGVVGDVERGRC